MSNRLALVDEGAGMSEAEAPYEMANLTPRMTGLPMVVWVSHRGRARHDVRVKVQQAHGRRMSPSNTASVAVRPTPHLVGGQLSAADLLAVSEWIRRNEAVIIGYWEGSIDTGELIQRLRPISPPIPP
jgi:hypothetical protein